jgi:tetratricopeptide (TPR) repeat protein
VLEIQVIETRKKVLGQDHPDTLTSMGNLASIFMEQERWKDAAELETQVLETSKRVYGAEHPDTLTSKDNLASALSKQGRWKEAEELEMQVVDTSKRVLGEDHPDTLTGIANLAATLTKHGRWKEAEELGLQVLEARKRVLGERHPDTLTSMKNLAVTCSNQRRSKVAQEREIEMANKTQMKADEDNPLPAVSTTISASLNKESEVPRHLTDDNENCQAKVEIPRSETINVSTEQGKKMGLSPTTRSQTKKNRNVPQNEQGEKRSAFGLAGVAAKRQKRDGNTKNKGKKEHSHPIGL